MIDLLSTTQILLSDAGYTTRLISLGATPLVCFEDDVVVGFACIFDSPQSLLSGWRERELAILNRFAPSFRSAGDKAWNVYSVFLCGPTTGLVEAREIRWIEEDLERTRKIAACGIASRQDLVRTLLPVMALQYQPVLRAEDATERLQRRISSISPNVARLVLDSDTAPTDVAQLLGDSP
ncbi:MAG: hypothetical protein QOD42_3725 [Sphingomonadales bacterium]|jgi:hypothetical protein|nr:hypothetical protein [Sphingomonadales bacterium]